MELYQLKTFLVIARTGNLTRAASELHASQPTVSGQLKALEDELGLTLFERTTRGMKLTEAGNRLRNKAQELTDLATELTV
ncbi:MAG TPA: LysR family transcriptional regulator, partial [Polyangiaceae bacterium]